MFIHLYTYCIEVSNISITIAERKTKGLVGGNASNISDSAGGRLKSP